MNGGGAPIGSASHQVLSPMAITTFPVHPGSAQPTFIDPSLISQYSGMCMYLFVVPSSLIFMSIACTCPNSAVSVLVCHNDAVVVSSHDSQSVVLGSAVDSP